MLVAFLYLVFQVGLAIEPCFKTVNVSFFHTFKMIDSSHKKVTLNKLKSNQILLPFFVSFGTAAFSIDKICSLITELNNNHNTLFHPIIATRKKKNNYMCTTDDRSAGCLKELKAKNVRAAS